MGTGGIMFDRSLLHEKIEDSQCLLPTLVSQTSDFPLKEKEHHTLFTSIGIWLKFLQTIVCQAA